MTDIISPLSVTFLQEVAGGVIVERPDIQALQDLYSGPLPANILLSPDSDGNLISDQAQVRWPLYRNIIDQSARFIAAHGVNFQIHTSGDLAQSGKTKWEKMASRCWGGDHPDAYEKAQAEILEWEISLATTGHIFVKHKLHEAKGNKPAWVEHIHLNPRFVYKAVAPDNIKHLRGYVIIYEGNVDPVLVAGAGSVMSGAMMRRLYVEVHPFNPDTEMWEDVRVFGSPTLAATGIEETDSIEWNKPYSMITETTNLPFPHSAYGMPDLAADVAAEGQVKTLFVASTINKILKFHSSPKTIISGASLDPDKPLSAAADGLWVIETEDGRQIAVTQLQMEGDLRAAREWYSTMKHDFYSAGGAVDISPETLKNISLGSITGIALRLLWEPQVIKRVAKLTLRSPFYNEINRKDMCELGEDDWDDAKLAYATHFGEPLPIVIAEQSAAIAQDRAMGLVSKETASTMRGYEWDREKQRLEQEAKEVAEAEKKVMEEGIDPDAQPGLPGQPALIPGGKGVSGQPAQGGGNMPAEATDPKATPVAT